jgi:hypothetical protein
MSNSAELMTINGLGILPFKNKDNVWTVIFNNIAKTFGNVSDAMMFAKGLVK